MNPPILSLNSGPHHTREPAPKRRAQCEQAQSSRLKSIQAHSRLAEAKTPPSLCASASPRFPPPIGNCQSPIGNAFPASSFPSSLQSNRRQFPEKNHHLTTLARTRGGPLYKPILNVLSIFDATTFGCANDRAIILASNSLLLMEAVPRLPPWRGAFAA